MFQKTNSFLALAIITFSCVQCSQSYLFEEVNPHNQGLHLLIVYLILRNLVFLITSIFIMAVG